MGHVKHEVLIVTGLLGEVQGVLGKARGLFEQISTLILVSGWAVFVVPPDGSFSTNDNDTCRSRKRNELMDWIDQNPRMKSVCYADVVFGDQSGFRAVVSRWLLGADRPQSLLSCLGAVAVNTAILDQVRFEGLLRKAGEASDLLVSPFNRYRSAYLVGLDANGISACAPAPEMADWFHVTFDAGRFLFWAAAVPGMPNLICGSR